MSKLQKLGFVGPVCMALAWSAMAHASDMPAMDTELHLLDNEWAHIKYQINDKDEQLKEIEALAKDASVVVARYPGHAEPLLWEGIITSEEAAMASVFRQLGLATSARKMFEKAEEIDPKAQNGAVFMSLGVIYYRVPGFPIGFGDDKRARRYLETAVAMDPDGLDGNYFYGDFLIEQGEYSKAKAVLARALELPMNPDRPVWDAGRRTDIQALIAKIDKHTNR